MKVTRVKNTISRIYYHLPFEAFVWISGLTLLALYDPLKDQHHSFCLLKGLGYDFCPGCGLGRSVSLILHGDFTGAWGIHPMGFPAVGILLYRSFAQTGNYIKDILFKKTIPWQTY